MRAYVALIDKNTGEEKYPMPLDGMTPKEIAAVWNRLSEHGGAVIRWHTERGEYLTSSGDAYSVEDVEATVRGLLAEQE